MGRILVTVRNMADVSTAHAKFYSVAGKVLCGRSFSFLDCTSFQFFLFSMGNMGLQTSMQRSAEALYNYSAFDGPRSFSCALHTGIFISFYSK